MLHREERQTRPIVTLESRIADILVTENGSLSPYIKVCHYSPENASLESLGTLIGVFTITDRSEPSAYIVNFLASVAKKEYFSQPRRGATESLEAALTRVNRALGELIKQDNTDWLGTLHAAVCVIDNGVLHFSVTGEGHVILIRNGFLSLISEGLAPEEATSHPLKTFCEISSGRLQDGDTVVVATPEILEAVSLDELERAAKHFPNERFEQFLRTATVNQLPLGGALIISSREVTLAPKTRRLTEVPEESVLETIDNVFSQNTFRDCRNFRSSVMLREAPHQLSTTPEKTPNTHYTDTQTGHIYVQGEAVPESATATSTWNVDIWQERWERLTDFLRKHRHSVSYSGKTLFATFSQTISRSVRANIPILRRIGLRLWMLFIRILQAIRQALVDFFRWYRTLTGYPKYIVTALLGAGIMLIFLSGKALFTTKPPVTPIVLAPTPTSIAPHPNTEPALQTLTTLAPIAQADGIVSATALGKRTLTVLDAALIVSEATGQNTTHTFPAGSGKSLHAMALESLQTLFILTNTGAIIAFTPANGHFAPTNLTLNTPGNIVGLAGYLSYLYVLDANKSKIMRYPHTTEGWGEGTSWLREPVGLVDTSGFDTGSDLFVANGSTLRAYARGKLDSAKTFENSTTPISYDQVTVRQDADTDLPAVLDTRYGRIILYDANGHITRQLAHDTFKQAKSLAWTPTGDHLLIATDTSVYAVPVQ